MATQRILGLATAIAVACSGAHDDGSITVARQPLSTPGLTAEPCAWDGDTVEVLVADAWAGCSAMDADIEKPELYADFFGNDPYLTHVLALMNKAGASWTNPFADWREIRNDKDKNCDPVSGKPAASGVTIQLSVIPERMSLSAYFFERDRRASGEIRQAGVNLCIAQRLRALSPGSVAGGALLLNDADQRLLLETIRERAQIAMLQYALLGVVFSTKFKEEINQPWVEQRIPLLQGFAAAHPGHMMTMGRDFAAAVQLHSLVSEELFHLFARSRSARAKRGGVSATRGDELWGPGSWYQRMLAAAYGGDPLVTVDGSTPWTHWNPNQHLSGDAGVGGNWYDVWYDWPDSLRRPYATQSVTEPQVREFLNLARRFNRIDLLPNTSPTCEPFDVEKTGEELYKVVEGELRVADCFKKTPSDPCPTMPTAPAKKYGEEPYLLWEKHRITPEHARSLAAVLAQSLGGRNSAPGCALAAANLTDAQFGARDTAGTVTSAGGWTHLGTDAAFTDLGPLEIGPTFTRNASLRFPAPWEIEQGVDGSLWDVVMSDLAFDDFCVATVCTSYKNADAKRLMGAIAAQAATREMVVSSLAYLSMGLGQTNTLWSYFLEAENILKVIEGGIGPTSISIRPDVERTIAAGSGLPGTSVKSDPSLGHAHSVTVLVPSSDPWWDSQCNDAGCTAVTGVAAIQGPWARALAANPKASIYGKTLFDLILAWNGTSWVAAPGAVIAYAGTVAPPAPFWVKNMPKVWMAAPLVLPSPPGGGETYDPTAVYTLVAFRADAKSASPVTFRLLGANVKLAPAEARDAQYFAGGGTFGNWVSGQTATQPWNPSAPAIDGFGLSTTWVPPLSAQLIGGVPGQTSAEVYLSLAKSSADAAGEAVEAALQGLVEQQQDEAAETAAAAKAVAGLKEDRDALCGSDNVACDTTSKVATITNPFSNCDPNTATDESEKAKCELDRLVFQKAAGIAERQFPLATPVAKSISEPTVPAFSSYSGGALQEAFIQQWNAIIAVPKKLDQLSKTANAAKATIAAAQAALKQAEELQRVNCGAQAMHNAVVAGKPVEKGSFYGPDSGGCTEEMCLQSWSWIVEDDISHSMAPLIAQQQKCVDLMTGIDPQIANVALAQANAYAQVGNALVAVDESITSVQLAIAKIARLINDAALADRRHKLEQSLTQFGLKTSFGAYRIGHGYDLWRARALVESSRRYALAARRAVEARYVVDLSALDKDEVFVESPAVWADEVYGYDLSLPAAVGLTVSAESGTAAVYPNKVGDYVANIEAFIKGYAASRPSAVANNDIDVVDLAGLEPTEAVVLPIDPSDPNSPTITAHPATGQWLYRCPGTSDATPTWVPASVGCPGQPPGQPDRAKLLFSLDPWGRRGGDISDPPFEKRYNSRWDLLAVNFVGTGIRDCTKASDPNACYSQPFIKYNLTQSGTPWVTDFDEFWRFLDVPTGRIEGAKGIAAELWLDPLKDGWSTSYIAGVSRSEWQNRPFGGSYELEFEVTPDIKLERIERIQLLVGSTSWVKQQ